MVDKISSYGIILVFISLAFVHIEKAIKDFTDKEKPNAAQSHALGNFRSEKKYLLMKCVFITLFSIITWYITLPDSLQIIQTSYLNLYDFEEIETTYILMSFSLLSVNIILIGRFVKLLKK